LISLDSWSLRDTGKRAEFPAIQETAIDEMPRLQHLSGDVVGWEEKLDQHREESAKLDTLSLGRRNR
jgi:hypothetical protein